MSVVSKFIIDEKTIDISDETARRTASKANTTATEAKTKTEKNTADIAAIKALPRLHVEYTENTSTITFTDGTHTA